MALGGASNPGVNSVTAKLNTAVTYDHTNGNISGMQAHLGTTAPAAATVQTVTASPYTYTNFFTSAISFTALQYTGMQIMQVFISGGTISALSVTRNSVVTALPPTASVVLLSTNDALTITYSVAPTVTSMQIL